MKRERKTIIEIQERVVTIKVDAPEKPWELLAQQIHRIADMIHEEGRIFDTIHIGWIQ